MNGHTSLDRTLISTFLRYLFYILIIDNQLFINNIHVIFLIS